MTTSIDYSQLTGAYTIDPAHTRLGFVARHAMVTKVVVPSTGSPAPHTSTERTSTGRQWR
jgi:polyisoprenoid-binding protein YceI